MFSKSLVRLCASVVAILSCSVVAAYAVPATKPLPYSWHDFYAYKQAHAKQHVIEAYKQVGQRGPWDDAAIKLLDRTMCGLTYWRATPVYRPKDLPSDDELVKLAKAAMDAKCSDPLVRHFCADALYNAGRTRKATPQMTQAVTELAKSKYSSATLFLAAARLWAIDTEPESRAAIKPIINSHMVKMVSEKLDNNARRLMIERLFDFIEPQPLEARDEWVTVLRNAPGVDRWVVDVVGGDHEIDLAWKSRGSGFANTVTPEGWKGFREHLAKAREHLTAAHALAPDVPTAANRMITVAMGEDGDQETPMEWFERAIAAQVDYHAAYDAILNSLLPRWGGSHEQMYDVGLKALESDRYDTDGPWQLVRAVEMIGNDTDQGWGILQTPGVYDALCAVADRYVDAHADDGKASRYLTYRAALGWQKGDHKDARRFLDRAGEGIDFSAFRLVGCANPPAAVMYTYAVTSPQSELVTRAEAAIGADRYDDAIKIFREVQSAPDLHAQVKLYADTRIVHAEYYAKIDRGEWIDIQPKPGLDGWSRVSRGGKWRVEGKDDALIAESTDQSPARLLREYDFGPRMEVSGSFELIGIGHPTPALSFSCGGHAPVFVQFTGGGIVLNIGTRQLPLIPSDVLQGANGPVEFACSYDRGTLNVRLAGQHLVVDHKLDKVDLPEVYVGVVVANGGIKFSGLKFRKLVDAAAEPKAAK